MTKPENLLAAIRIFIQRHVFRYDQELCRACGKRLLPVIWNAPDELWFEIMGTLAGIQCIKCFTKKSYKTLIWRPEWL